MFTQRAKVLAGIVVFVLAVGGLSYVQEVQQKEIVSLKQPVPITLTKTIVVTPTNVPTATPAAGLKYTPVVKAVVLPTKEVTK